MTRHCLYEMRLAIHPAIWLLPGALAILRLITGPGPERFLNSLEFIFPLLFPIAVIAALRRERGDRTLEVLIATPHPKVTILSARMLGVMLPLLCAVAATVSPVNWLSILAPGVFLAMLAVLTGLIWKEEIGLVVALGWWAISFAVSFAQMGLARHPVASWFLLFLLGSSLSPTAILLRKLGQLAAAAVLFSSSVLVAENWPRPVFSTWLNSRRPLRS
jgi:ABC-type Na+ efflux pump permease subunit